MSSVNATSKARNWTFTINNPNQGNESSLTAFAKNPKVKWMMYQYEESQTGTVHLQGAFCYDGRVSARQLGKTLAGEPGTRLNPILIEDDVPENREGTPDTVLLSDDESDMEVEIPVRWGGEAHRGWDM